MSRLGDAIAAEQPHGKGPICGIRRIRDAFDDEDRAAFDALLEEVRTGTRSAASVSRILGRIGVAYSSNNITHHMRGECACGRENRP